MEDLYQQRDIDSEELSGLFEQHLSAMTGESLHKKSAIAAELAHRDLQILKLKALHENLDPVFMWCKASSNPDEQDVVDVDCKCPDCVPLYTTTLSQVPGMKHITDNSQLKVGREYWCRIRGQAFATPFVCHVRDGMRYLADHIWAEDSNNQALQRWEIFGPIPPRQSADFDAVLKAEIKEEPK